MRATFQCAFLLLLTTLLINAIIATPAPCFSGRRSSAVVDARVGLNTKQVVRAPEAGSQTPDSREITIMDGKSAMFVMHAGVDNWLARNPTQEPVTMTIRYTDPADGVAKTVTRTMSGERHQNLGISKYADLEVDFTSFG